jgi:hypothetical protein
MIQVIHGKKGSGKTKRIIDLANHSIKESKSDVLFIDDDNRYMFDLRHEVRFINAGEYGIISAEMFLGFLCGLLAQNFDVGTIFIDAFLKLMKIDLKDSQWFFERVDGLCERHGVDFVLSISEDTENLPEYIRKYVI